MSKRRLIAAQSVILPEVPEVVNVIAHPPAETVEAPVVEVPSGANPAPPAADAPPTELALPVPRAPRGGGRRPKSASSKPKPNAEDDSADEHENHPSRIGVIRLKEISEMARARGLQSAKPARALLKTTFSAAAQHDLAVLVMQTALESTANQQRKRVLVRDVEPLIALLKGLALQPALLEAVGELGGSEAHV